MVYGRVLDDSDGDMSKVPFSLKRVSGSFTCKALRKELITEISEIKKMSRSAAQDIAAAIRKCQQGKSQHPANRYKKLSEESKII